MLTSTRSCSRSGLIRVVAVLRVCSDGHSRARNRSRRPALSFRSPHASCAHCPRPASPCLPSCRPRQLLWLSAHPLPPSQVSAVQRERLRPRRCARSMKVDAVCVPVEDRGRRVETTTDRAGGHQSSELHVPSAASCLTRRRPPRSRRTRGPEHPNHDQEQPARWVSSSLHRRTGGTPEGRHEDRPPRPGPRRPVDRAQPLDETTLQPRERHDRPRARAGHLACARAPRAGRG